MGGFLETIKCCTVHTTFTTVCVPSRYAGILTTHLLQRTNIVFVFAFVCWVGLLQINLNLFAVRPCPNGTAPRPPLIMQRTKPRSSENCHRRSMQGVYWQC